jgi:hypothetical protein
MQKPSRHAKTQSHARMTDVKVLKQKGILCASNRVVSLKMCGEAKNGWKGGEIKDMRQHLKEEREQAKLN